MTDDQNRDKNTPYALFQTLYIGILVRSILIDTYASGGMLLRWIWILQFFMIADGNEYCESLTKTEQRKKDTVLF